MNEFETIVKHMEKLEAKKIEIKNLKFFIEQTHGRIMQWQKELSNAHMNLCSRELDEELDRIINEMFSYSHREE